MSDKGAEAVAAILHERRDAVVIECGACDCDTTLAILRRVGQGHVARWYAFEPDPRNVQKALANLANNAQELGVLLDAIVLVPAAISDFTGVAELRQSGRMDGTEWTGSSTTRVPTGSFAEGFPWMKLETPAGVPCITLDEFALRHEIGHVDVLWADIEGSERQLVLGGRETLRKTDYAFLETWDTPLFEDQWVTSELLGELEDWELLERIESNLWLHRKGAPT